MKKKFWMAALALGLSILGGCGSSSVAGSQIANAEKLNLNENASVEKLIEQYNSMHSMCRGDSDTSSNENETQQACALRDKLAERLNNENYCFLQSEQEWLSCETAEVVAEHDPFPYTAILTCSLSAFKNTGIPLLACMNSEYSSSSLRIRNGDDLEVLKGWQVQNSEKYVFTDRGLEIPLGRISSIKIPNNNENLLLSMQVLDNDGNVLYNEVAERFDTLEFNSPD
jgi:hypothetical protein